MTISIWESSAVSDTKSIPDGVDVISNYTPEKPGIEPLIPAINTKPYLETMVGVTKKGAFPVVFDYYKPIVVDPVALYGNCQEYLNKIDITKYIRAPACESQGGSTACVEYAVADPDKTKKLIYDNTQITISITKLKDSVNAMNSEMNSLNEHLNSLVNDTAQQSLVTTAKLVKTAIDIDPTITDADIKKFYSMVSPESVVKINGIYAAFNREWNAALRVHPFGPSNLTAMIKASELMTERIKTALTFNRTFLERASKKTNEFIAAASLVEVYGKSTVDGTESPVAEPVTNVVEEILPIEPTQPDSTSYIISDLAEFTGDDLIIQSTNTDTTNLRVFPSVAYKIPRTEFYNTHEYSFSLEFDNFFAAQSALITVDCRVNYIALNSFNLGSPIDPSYGSVFQAFYAAPFNGILISGELPPATAIGVWPVDRTSQITKPGVISSVAYTNSGGAANNEGQFINESPVFRGYVPRIGNEAIDSTCKYDVKIISYVPATERYAVSLFEVARLRTVIMKRDSNNVSTLYYDSGETETYAPKYQGNDCVIRIHSPITSNISTGEPTWSVNVTQQNLKVYNRS